MSNSVTIRADDLPADHWQAVRCELPGGRPGPRVIDINHRRSEVRYRCPKCRAAHVVPVVRRDPLRPSPLVAQSEE